MTLEDAAWVDADRMSGAPCFRGSRLSVQQLFDWLADGVPLAVVSVDDNRRDALLDAVQDVALAVRETLAGHRQIVTIRNWRT